MHRLPGGLALVLLAASPATALEFHPPFASVSLDASYDDHISGHSEPEAALYPAGNSDWRYALSLGGGMDLSLDDRWGLYVGARVRAFRYANYPELSGLLGSLSTEVSAYRLPLGLDGFLSYGFASDGSKSHSHTTILSLERPVGERLTMILAGGHYWQQTDLTGLANRGPFVDLGLRLRFPTRTIVATYLSVMGLEYDYGRADRILSASVSVSQGLWKGAYLRASYRRDHATSNEPGRSFPGNAFSLGTSQYF